MKIKEVTIERTFNLGNYENVKPGVTATIEEGEDPKEVMKILDKELHDFRSSLCN